MKRIAAATCLAFAAACTAKAGGEQIEKKIVEIYAGQGLTVAKATCPKSIEMKVGGTFTCQARFDNGETFTVQGLVTSKEGTEAQYNLVVVEPNYIAAKLETIITEGLTAQIAAPKSVTCGAPGLHHVPADRRLACTAVDPDGVSHNVVFKFTADGAPDRWDVE